MVDPVDNADSRDWFEQQVKRGLLVEDSALSKGTLKPKNLLELPVFTRHKRSNELANTT